MDTFSRERKKHTSTAGTCPIKPNIQLAQHLYLPAGKSKYLE